MCKRLPLPALALLLFSAGLYLCAIDRTMQYDEAFTFYHYSGSPAAVLIYSLPNNHIPHSALVWLARTLMGDSRIAVRFPAFVAALLAVGLVYRMGTRRAGESAGLLVAALFSTTWAVMDYATQARGYSLTMLLTLVLTSLALYAQPARRRWNYAVVGTVAALVLTLPTMLIFIGGLVLFCRALSRPTFVGVVIAGIVLLPSLIYVPSFLRFTEPDPASSVLTFFAPTPLPAVLMVAGLILSRQRYTDDRLVRLTLFSIGVAAAVCAGQYFITGRTLPLRTFVYLIPLLCLAAAPALRWRRGLALLCCIGALSSVERLTAPSLVDRQVAQILQGGTLDMNANPDAAIYELEHPRR